MTSTVSPATTAVAAPHPSPNGSSRPLRVVRGACPHDCPDTCATLTEVDEATGRAVRFYADKDHPVTQGWLCAKVRPYLERVYHPDRLLYPLRRVGPKGSHTFERISWDDAIGEIVSALAGHPRARRRGRDSAVLLQRDAWPRAIARL